ncbi:hypothetical protein M8C21_015777, partial [Ambrosia artemisiifolia]
VAASESVDQLVHYSPIMTSSNVVVSAFALVFAITLPTAVHGQPFAPPPPTVSDGTSIDQGIAYLLMILALVLTYIIHTIDTPLNLRKNYKRCVSDFVAR